MNSAIETCVFLLAATLVVCGGALVPRGRGAGVAFNADTVHPWSGAFVGAADKVVVLAWDNQQLTNGDVVFNVLQTSSNLTDWADFGTFPSNGTNQCVVVTNAPNLFFRFRSWWTNN